MAAGAPDGIDTTASLGSGPLATGFGSSIFFFWADLWVPAFAHSRFFIAQAQRQRQKILYNTLRACARRTRCVPVVAHKCVPYYPLPYTIGLVKQSSQEAQSRVHTTEKYNPLRESPSTVSHVHQNDDACGAASEQTNTHQAVVRRVLMFVNSHMTKTRFRKAANMTLDFVTFARRSDVRISLFRSSSHSLCARA